MTDQAEWRLSARVGSSDRVDDAIRRLRGRRRVLLRAATPGTLPAGVTLTHRHGALFAYASTRSEIEAARSAIALALSAADHDTEWRMSVWDADIGEWRQIEPAPSAEQQARYDALTRAAAAPTTRTRVCSAFGWREYLVLTSAADEAWTVGVSCRVAEEQRLFRTRLTFTASGPAARVDAFMAYLDAEIKRMRPYAGGGG